MLAMLTFAVFMIQMKPFRQFLNENPSIETGAMNVLTSVWLYVGIFICIVAVVWFFCTNSRSKIVLKIKNFIVNIWDGFASIITMKGKFWFVFIPCLFGSVILCNCMSAYSLSRYGRFDGLGGLVTLCIG